MDLIKNNLLAKLEAQNSMEITLDKFKLLTTDEERVKFAMDFLDGEELLGNLQESMKDSKVSLELKNKANQLYTSPNQSYQLDKIIELYTRSVAYAPEASPTLSIAFANRSAALFKGRLYDECLKDIKRALDLEYPDGLKAKLLTRKAQCLVVLGAPAQEIDDTVQEARKWLEKMDKNNQSRQLIETILNNPIKKRDFPERRILLDDERNLPAILKENPEVDGLSSAAEIKYSEKFGRHVIATKDINPGELIGIEKCYASFLEKEMLYIYCSNCFKRTWSGIPCKFCTQVIYCSEKCLEEAWEDHHDMECQLFKFKTYDILNIKNLKNFFLGLRLCVRALKEAGGIENLREALKKIDPRQVGFTNDTSGDKRFVRIYDLATAATQKCSTFTSLYVSTIYSYFLQMLSNKNSLMFGKQLEGNLKLLAQDPSVTFIGGLIIRYIQIAANNSYYISEGFAEKNILRGSSIFSTFSYLNHSCDPNCYLTASLGRTMILHANTFIKKGEQIFITYGPNFACDEKAERQQHLSIGYFFNCECEACTNNWPVADKLPLLEEIGLPTKIIFQAVNYMNLCQKYDNTINYDTRLSDTKKIIKNFGVMIQFFQKNLPIPSQELTCIRLTLASILNRQGNCPQTLNQ